MFEGFPVTGSSITKAGFYPTLTDGEKITHHSKGWNGYNVIEEIVMQGDVLAPLISSLQVDTIGKECLQDKKHLYFFKGIVPIPPLGMVDDLFTISECGVKTSLLNQFINVKTASKKLQFGTTKCIKMHIGKSESDALCKDLHVGSWKIDVIDDPVTGKPSNKEYCDRNGKKWGERMNKPANINQLVVIGKLMNQLINKLGQSCAKLWLS